MLQNRTLMCIHIFFTIILFLFFIHKTEPAIKNFEIPKGNHAEVGLQTDVMTKQFHCHGIWSVYNILNFQKTISHFTCKYIQLAINIWVNMWGEIFQYDKYYSCRFDLCWWYHATVELWKIVHMVNRVLTLEHLHYIIMHPCSLTSNTIWWLRLCDWNKIHLK